MVRQLILGLMLLMTPLAAIAADHELVISERDTFVLRDSAAVKVEDAAVVQAGQAAARLKPQQGLGFSMVLQFILQPVDPDDATSFSQQLEAAGRPYLDQAAEKTQVKPLKYAGRSGLYAVYTDSRLVNVEVPPPNDYRYAVVGIVRLSEDTVLRYDLLVNDMASKDYFEPLHYALSFVKPADSTTLPAREAATPATQPGR